MKKGVMLVSIFMISIFLVGIVSAGWFDWFKSDNAKITGNVILETIQHGYTGTVAVPGDYDGDGTDDLAVYDLNNGKWYIRDYEGNSLAWGKQHGYRGAIPVSGDYNGDGKDDLAVYGMEDGKWYILDLNGNSLAWGKQHGYKGAKPYSVDYNNDGKSDLAVKDSRTGVWYIIDLENNVYVWGETSGIDADDYYSGVGGMPVADYNGDGLDDYVSYNGIGSWSISLGEEEVVEEEEEEDTNTTTTTTTTSTDNGSTTTTTATTVCEDNEICGDGIDNDCDGYIDVNCADPYCNETDNGEDHYEYGEVEYGLDDGSVHEGEDICEGNVLDEYYCLGDEIKQQEYECPYGCENGACLEEKLAECDDPVILYEGGAYNLENVNIEIAYIDGDSVKLELNDQITDTLEEGMTYSMDEFGGLSIGIADIYGPMSAEDKGMAVLCLEKENDLTCVQGTSSFDLIVDGRDRVVINDIQTDTGVMDLDVLHGNGIEFEGLGKDDTHQLVTSNTIGTTSTPISISLNETLNNYFVVSWVNGDDSETYAYELDEIDEDKDNQTILRSMSDDADITIDSEGEYETQGNVKYTLSFARENYPSKGYATIDITAAGAGKVYVNRIYSVNGDYLVLPVEIEDSTFPSEETYLKVYNQNNELISAKLASWANNEIVLEDVCEFKECTSNYFCTSEPTVCPPHGEQTETCVDLNECTEDYTSNVLCTPNSCSGCFTPRWEGGDNVCVPYGHRMLLEEGDSGTIYQSDFDEGLEYYNVTILDDNSFKIEVIKDIEAGDDFKIIANGNVYYLKTGESRTIYEGEEYEITIIEGDYQEEYKITIGEVVANTDLEEGYVEITINEEFASYCDIDGEIKEQKTEYSDGTWASCQNNYECESNLCSAGECIELADVVAEANAMKEFFVKFFCKVANPISDDEYATCVFDAIGVDVNAEE